MWTRRANGALVQRLTGSTSRRNWYFTLSLKAGRTVPVQRQRGRCLSYLEWGQLFVLVKPLAHPCWGRGQSAFLSLLTEMLISPRSILTDTPRGMFDQISGHHVTRSSQPIKLTVIITNTQITTLAQEAQGICHGLGTPYRLARKVLSTPLHNG